MVRIDGVSQFEELIVSLEKLEPSYKVKSVALLNRLGSSARAQVASITPIMKRAWSQRKKGELRSSWKFLPVKHYKDNKVAVVRIQSDSNYAHLEENDHKVYTAGRKKLNKKIARASIKDLKAARVKYHGVRTGTKMLARTMEAMESSYYSGIEQMFDEITKEFQ